MRKRGPVLVCVLMLVAFVAALTQSASHTFEFTHSGMLTLNILSDVSATDDFVLLGVSDETGISIEAVTTWSSGSLDPVTFTNNFNGTILTFDVKKNGATDAVLVVRVRLPRATHTICFNGACYGNCISHNNGVNIHFTVPQTNIIETLGEGQWGHARMDFSWAATEKQAGVYDFSNYKTLMQNLARYNSTPYYILDYSNPMYDHDLSPTSPAAIAAFAKMSMNAALSLEGNNIIWEMYNEPNNGFWKPRPNVTQYIALAQATGRAIKSATPHEIYVGPTVSTFDQKYIQSCFDAGLLNLWDAVSFHPYRGSNPETAAKDYAVLRSMIKAHKPQNKPHINIFSGEWGYPTEVPYGYTEEVQAQYLARQYLNNVLNEIPISIWYDFHDDGTNNSYSEHRFGVFRNQYYENRVPAYDPKPSYLASITFFKFLRNLRFNKRLELGDDANYVLLFTESDFGNETVVVAWTTHPKPQQIQVPCSPGTVTVVNMYGNATSTITSNGAITLELTQSPQYAKPHAKNEFWSIISGIRRFQIDTEGASVVNLPIRVPNYSPSAIKVSVDDGAAVVIPAGQTHSFNKVVSPGLNMLETSPPFAVANIHINDMGSFSLGTYLIANTTFDVWIFARSGTTSATVVLFNQNSKQFTGSLTVTKLSDEKKGVASIRFVEGQSEVVAALQSGTTQSVTDLNSYSLVLADSNEKVVGTGSRSYQVADDVNKIPIGPIPSEYTYRTDGDNKVNMTIKMAMSLPKSKAPIDAYNNSFMLEYSLEAGYKYFSFMLRQNKLISSKNVSKIGMWIYGDGNNDYARLRTQDSSGQVFQFTFGQISWVGWEFKTVDVPGEASYFGGANDGVIHWPMYWQTYFLLDSTRNAHSGTLYFLPPVAEN